jgi:DNA-binding transcriptional LysR family regulator
MAKRVFFFMSFSCDSFKVIPKDQRKTRVPGLPCTGLIPGTTRCLSVASLKIESLFCNVNIYVFYLVVLFLFTIDESEGEWMFRRDGLMPSTENLLCFLVAAEHLHFRKAARQMALTPAAFGQRIKQLERQLGCALFERTSRSVALTVEGARLQPVARQAIEELLRCGQVVNDEQSLPVHIRLGTRFELGLSWLVPSLLAFQEAHPHIKIDYYFGSGPDILEQLEEQSVDGIITSAPRLHQSWQSEMLHRETYVFVGAKELLQNKPFARPEDAVHHTLIDIDEELPLLRYMSSVTGELAFGGIRLAGTAGAVQMMVERAVGVAVVPEYMIQEQLASGALERLLPSYDLLADSFRLLFRKSSLFGAALAQIATFLRECPLR